MLLMVVISVLEPQASRPQLGLQGMYDACHCVRLPQQAHLTKQVLIYGTASHQRQHLASHTKSLHNIKTKALLVTTMSAYVLDACTANTHIKRAYCFVKVVMACVSWCDTMLGGSVQQAKQVSKGCRWVADLASEEASRPEVKDDINDLVEGRADAHVLLCIQPTWLSPLPLSPLHQPPPTPCHQASLRTCTNIAM